MRAFLFALICSAATLAQTTGVVGSHDLTINGQGSQTSSCNAINIQGVLGVGISALPNSGIILGLSPSCAIGGQPIGTGTVDVSLIGAAFLMDSTGILAPGNAFNSFAFTNSAGVFSISVTAGFAPGLLGVMQAAVINPGYAQGAEMTQAQSITVIQSFCTVQGTPYAAGDDSFLQIPFTSVPNFTFYGVAYTDVFLASNGFLSFGSGSTDFSSSEVEWLSMQPRVAPAWGDWSPNIGGSVSYSEIGGIFTATWFEVPVFAAGATDRNTYCASLDLVTGDASIAWDGMARNNGTYNTIISGITPGGNLSLANNINLSAVNPATPFIALGATDAIYEDFFQGAFGGFDLSFSTKTFVPTGGVGVGPYIAQ